MILYQQWLGRLNTYIAVSVCCFYVISDTVNRGDAEVRRWITEGVWPLELSFWLSLSLSVLAIAGYGIVVANRLKLLKVSPALSAPLSCALLLFFGKWFRLSVPLVISAPTALVWFLASLYVAFGRVKARV